jgi:hypothetical protein
VADSDTVVCRGADGIVVLTADGADGGRPGRSESRTGGNRGLRGATGVTGNGLVVGSGSVTGSGSGFVSGCVSGDVGANVPTTPETDVSAVAMGVAPEPERIVPSSVLTGGVAGTGVTGGIVDVVPPSSPAGTSVVRSVPGVRSATASPAVGTSVVRTLIMPVGESKPGLGKSATPVSPVVWVVVPGSAPAWPADPSQQAQAIPPMRNPSRAARPRAASMDEAAEASAGMPTPGAGSASRLLGNPGHEGTVPSEPDVSGPADMLVVLRHVTQRSQ